MGLLSFLKQTFLPSEAVSRARRIKTFGSPSKLGAGLKIGGLAAAAIAAPPIVAAVAKKPAVIKQVASKITPAAKKATTAIGGYVAKKGAVGTTKQVIGATLVGGVVAGGGLKLLKPAFKGAKKATKAAVGVAEGKPLTPESAGDIAKTVGIVAGAAGLGAVAAAVIPKILDRKKAAPPAPKPAAPPILPVTAGRSSLTTPVPVTPQTQVMGRAAGAVSRKRRKRAVRRIQPVVNRQYVRVNVLNANQSRIIRR